MNAHLEPGSSATSYHQYLAYTLTHTHTLHVLLCRKFGHMLDLVPMADNVVKLKGKCGWVLQRSWPFACARLARVL